MQYNAWIAIEAKPVLMHCVCIRTGYTFFCLSINHSIQAMVYPMQEISDSSPWVGVKEIVRR